MSDDKKTTDAAADSELSDLLDSALEDFDKVAQAKVKDESPAVASAQPYFGKVVEEAATDETWSQDFIKQAADQFEKDLMQNLMQNGEDGDLSSSLQKIAQSVASAIGTTEGEGEVEGEGAGVNFQSAIAQALKDLSATSENLQNATPGISEADLAAMFGEVNLEDEGGDMRPFMQDMVETLLSKELIYPMSKEIVEQFPAWLEEKKTTLPAADLQRHKKQYELIQKVCTEYEKEQEGESEDAKKQRFDTILPLMNEIQCCGQLPDDLCAEAPQRDETCSVM